MSIYIAGGNVSGQNKLTGEEAWGSVVDEKGQDLLEKHLDILSDLTIRKETLFNGSRHVIVAKFNDVKRHNNNGAELLAFYAGLRIAIKTNKKCIFSNSQLMIDWWSRGLISTENKKSIDPNKLHYITTCGDLRKTFETLGGKVVKISSDINLAKISASN